MTGAGGTKPQGRLSRGPELPYKLLAGVEPCTGGWLVASGKLMGITLHPEAPKVYRTFREILDEVPAFSVIAVHMPIGLPTEPVPHGRTCEQVARNVLGFPRQGAIRSAPCRRALEAIDDYDKAAELNGGTLDVVTFSQLPRIADITAEVMSYHQRQIFETNPELAFFQLNDDTPMRYPKRSAEGFQERTDLLRHKLNGAERVLDARVRGARAAHRVDAMANLWTARRVMARAVRRVPEAPEWNDDGLRMEMVW